MCELFGVVQVHPLCCISHMAVLHSTKIQIQIQIYLSLCVTNHAYFENPDVMKFMQNIVSVNSINGGVGALLIITSHVQAAVLYDVIRKWCNILSTPFVIFSPCSLFGEYGKKKGNKIKDQKNSVSIYPAASGTSYLCMCSTDGILS